MNKSCSNCLHNKCLFHGENRGPVYNGNNPQKINCWDLAHDYAIATLAEGWVNCGKCRSPGSCGLTENCFGGHKDNG